MIDHIFSAALTFCLLVAGTLAVGAAMFGLDQRSAAHASAATHVRVVQLEPVVIVGKRLAPAAAMAKTDSGEPASQRVQ